MKYLIEHDNNMAIFLETERLILKVPTIHDYEDLLALRIDPEVMKYISNDGQFDGQVQTKEQVREHIELAKPYFDKYGLVFYCVFEKETGQFVGQAGLFHLGYNLEQSEIELAYRLHKKYWGRGYATELAKALIKNGFNDLKLPRIIAPVHPDNSASKRVMEKAGMSYYGLIDYRGNQTPCYEILNKNNVYIAYEKISDWFDQHRSKELFEKPYLDLIIGNIKSHAKILDLGCGTGEPIASYFIEQGYQLTGIDGSQKQIDLAKQRIPSANLIVADMRTLSLHEQFDAIIAWHSYFHLPKEDQRKMFSIFQKHIKPKGILVFTSGPDEGEVWGDNGGVDLYHASLSTKEYEELAKNHNFKVLKHSIEDNECGEATVWVMQYGE